MLTWASSRYVFGQPRFSTRSRFLDELPGSDVQRIGGAERESFAPSRELWIEDRGSTRVERFDGRPGRVLTRSAPPSGPSEAKVQRNGGETTLRLGQKVHHVRYGVGKITKFGTGSPPNIDVEFPEVGKKTIRADFLEPR